MEEQMYLENEILSKEFISDYNLDECKSIATMLMKKYKRLKNSCPEEVDLKITHNYEPIYSCLMPRKNAVMENN